jgi:hypothetical protein
LRKEALNPYDKSKTEIESALKERDKHGSTKATIRPPWSNASKNPDVQEGIAAGDG